MTLSSLSSSEISWTSRLTLMAAAGGEAAGALREASRGSREGEMGAHTRGAATVAGCSEPRWIRSRGRLRGAS